MDKKKRLFQQILKTMKDGPKYARWGRLSVTRESNFTRLRADRLTVMFYNKRDDQYSLSEPYAWENAQVFHSYSDEFFEKFSSIIKKEMDDWNRTKEFNGRFGTESKVQMRIRRQMPVSYSSLFKPEGGVR